jgi:hypothetical protein
MNQVATSRLFLLLASCSSEMSLAFTELLQRIELFIVTRTSYSKRYVRFSCISNSGIVRVSMDEWLKPLCLIPPGPVHLANIYRFSQEERSVFCEFIVSVILNKKVYLYMCRIPNGFRARTISLYSKKIVNKRDILRTVSNAGIYCSSDKFDTVYLV